MIAGIFHQGSGLGNQLFRYITVRTLAEDKGYGWGMWSPEDFKGTTFLNLDLTVPPSIQKNIFYEKKVVENGVDIRGYDPEINFIQDNTIIDGEFQDERYWGHRLADIDEWLAVDPLPYDDNTCVIGFRGGEYTGFPDLFLSKSYWEAAIAQKRAISPNMAFEVHTDDPTTARKFFPDFPIVENIELGHSNHSNMGLNWRAMRYAKHAIIANSSFYILPRLLSKGETIAPRYWARHNTKVWALPQNYYKAFKYL